MAKTRQAALIWSQEDQQYLWRDEHSTDTIDVREERKRGSGGWLRTPRSLFKDERDTSPCSKKRDLGEENGYWYAYRRQGKRTAKKYAGRTADLSAARLEHMARVLRVHRSRETRSCPTEMPGEQAMEESGLATAMAGQHQNSISSSPQTPLLVSKFHMPPLQPSLVPRERLLALLDRAWSTAHAGIRACGLRKNHAGAPVVAEGSQQQHFPPVAWFLAGFGMQRRNNDSAFASAPPTISHHTRRAA